MNMATVKDLLKWYWMPALLMLIGVTSIAKAANEAVITIDTFISYYQILVSLASLAFSGFILGSLYCVVVHYKGSERLGHVKWMAGSFCIAASIDTYTLMVEGYPADSPKGLLMLIYMIMACKGLFPLLDLTMKKTR